MYHAEVIDISREHALFAYADAYTRYANNMYNTANYYIRNLMTGLQKDIPTPNEASVIGIVREAVPGINASLRKKYETKAANIRADRSLTNAGRAEKLGKLKCSVFRMPTPDAWFAGYSLLDAVFRHTGNPDYRAGHAHVMQNAVKDCCEAWTSYFRSRAQSGRSGLPGYRRSGGHRTAVFSNTACKIRDGRLLFPALKVRPGDGTGTKKAARPQLRVRELKGSLIEVRILPYCGQYRVQIITDDGTDIEDVLPKETDIAGSGVMFIDPGLDNFASIADNRGSVPFVIKGGALKARNQWFNKETARLRSEQMKGHDPGSYRPPVTEQMHRLSRKREAFIRDTFYKISHFICREAVKREVTFIIMGHSKGQKQGIRTGHKNNQAFVNIPYAKFRGILATVAAGYGIRVILQEESYTSKASFGDGDPIPVYGEQGADKAVFSGKRIARGLYRESGGRIMNADINGACNIGRKYCPAVFDGVTNTDYLYRTVVPVRYNRLNKSIPGKTG